MKKKSQGSNVVRLPTCELGTLVRVTADLGREGRERTAAAARRMLKLLPPENPGDEKGDQTPSDEI